MEPLDYRKAGVDIEAGNEAVRRIGQLVKGTQRPEVRIPIGGFAGGFQLDRGEELLAGADGVGTKLLIAQQMDLHHTVGIDLVAMNVNDILAEGGEPLFFLDYIAIGRLVPDLVEALVSGVVEGCKAAGCALLGGETAEMPGLYPPGAYDLAGFAVGRRVVSPAPAEAGDSLIGLESSGFHANGFSLVRAIVDQAGLDLRASYPACGGQTLGEALLTPTRIYVDPVLRWAKAHKVRGMAHITGGGLVENLPRGLGGLGAQLSLQAWPVPELLNWLADLGNIETGERLRTFNAGIGFVLVCDPGDVDQALEHFSASGIRAWRIGETVLQPGVHWR